MDVFKRVTRGIRQNNQSSSDFPSFNFFFTQELNNNIGSASKSKEDIRRGKMSEPVEVQNHTQIHNHEVEEDFGEDFFFACSVSCMFSLICLVIFKI